MCIKDFPRRSTSSQALLTRRRAAIARINPNPTETEISAPPGPPLIARAAAQLPSAIAEGAAAHAKGARLPEVATHASPPPHATVPGQHATLHVPGLPADRSHVSLAQSSSRSHGAPSAVGVGRAYRQLARAQIIALAQSESRSHAGAQYRTEGSSSATTHAAPSAQFPS